MVFAVFPLQVVVVLLIQSSRCRCCSQCIRHSSSRRSSFKAIPLREASTFPTATMSKQQDRTSSPFTLLRYQSRQHQSRPKKKLLPKRNALRPLNTLQNLLISTINVLSLHLRLRLSSFLATTRQSRALTFIGSSFDLLRRSFGLLARSRFAHTAGRSSIATARDLGALERVPASAQGAAVFVAE